MRITQYSPNVYKGLLSERVNLYYMPKAKLWKLEQRLLGQWILYGIYGSYSTAIKEARELSNQITKVNYATN